MDALHVGGAITRADRRRHMDRFRLDRGPLFERERRAIARLAGEFGPATLGRAGQSAAANRLAIPIPVPAERPTEAAA